MRAAGDGARGLIGATAPGAEIGHAFNVVNVGGEVRFLDGQTGLVADVTPYKSFNLLRTH